VFKAIAQLLLCILLGIDLSQPLPASAAQLNHDTWRGVHIWLDNDAHAQELVKTLPGFAAAGANVVIVEVNYSFEFQSHPELRNSHYVKLATAHALATAARNCGVRIIPEFNCLGHQSFAGKISPLLQLHPEFNEAPTLSLGDTNVYCLEWCPCAQGLNKIIFSLIDDIAAGFESDAFHVGMDEVYLIGNAECPRCHGRNPSKLYADQVKALHEHIVGKKKLQMFMWADRVIGPKYQGYSRYDNAHNDLSEALDKIPLDIVMCDWHYEWRNDYPSIALLSGKGFQVWPAGFLPEKAAQKLSDFALAHRSQVMGYLATTWTTTSISKMPDWPPIKNILPRWKEDE